MKRLLLIPILLISLCSTLWAVEPVQLARMNPYIAGVTVSAAAGTTWYYPSDITSFPNTSANIATGIKVGATITPGVSVTITKLAYFVGDKQSATECSIGIFQDTVSANKLAGCHFTPATGEWGECTINYAINSGTTYVLWEDCNADYKLKGSSTACTPYYSNQPPYTQDMPATISRSADSGCAGIRMGY